MAYSSGVAADRPYDGNYQPYQGGEDKQSVEVSQEPEEAGENSLRHGGEHLAKDHVNECAAYDYVETDPAETGRGHGLSLVMMCPPSRPRFFESLLQVLVGFLPQNSTRCTLHGCLDCSFSVSRSIVLRRLCDRIPIGKSEFPKKLLVRFPFLGV